MFRELAKKSEEEIFNWYSDELLDYLESAWRGAKCSPGCEVYQSKLLLNDGCEIPRYKGSLEKIQVTSAGDNDADGVISPCVHLIYAFMIENTRVYDIFAKVIEEYRRGDKLGYPSLQGVENWLTNTERLLYSELPPLYSYSLTSRLRPDFQASRREAYYRMFGMDLSHSHPYRKPEVCNNDFVATFQEFLRQFMIGIANLTNSSGAKPTDKVAIGYLADRLKEMLKDKRRVSDFQRVEFFSVAMMSWCHLTLDSNSPIVRDMKADAQSPYDRLVLMGKKVGLSPHPKAANFFRLADDIADVMISLESGTFTQSYINLLLPDNVGAVILPNVMRDKLQSITMHWMFAANVELKSPVVTVSRDGQPSAAMDGARKLLAAPNRAQVEISARGL